MHGTHHETIDGMFSTFDSDVDCSVTTSTNMGMDMYHVGTPPCTDRTGTATEYSVKHTHSAEPRPSVKRDADVID